MKMKPTATTFIVTALATTSPFLPVAANCGMSNFQIKTSATQNEQRTEKTEETKHNVDEVVVESTISRRDLRQRGSKSSKDPHECDIETVQRALMCSDYLFKTLNNDVDDELGQDNWGVFATRAGSGEADREIKAAKNVCGRRFDDVDFEEIANFASTNNATMTRVELEIEMILAFCDNDLEGFVEANVLGTDGPQCR